MDHSELFIFLHLTRALYTLTWTSFQCANVVSIDSTYFITHKTQLYYICLCVGSNVNEKDFVLKK